MLDKEAFTKALLWGEAGSMIAEAKVHDELGLKTNKPAFFYKTTADQQEAHINISEYTSEHGQNGLFNFLRNAVPAKPEQEAYGSYYEKHYLDYVLNFNKNQPNMLKLIQQWVRSGRHAEDI